MHINHRRGETRTSHNYSRWPHRPWSQYLQHYGQRKFRATIREYIFRSDWDRSVPILKDKSNPWDWD